MNLKANFIKKWWGSLLGAALAVGFGIILHDLPLGLGLIHWSYDLPFAVRGTMTPPEAVLVYMDDDSHTRLQQPKNAPWDRLIHAKLIERLTAAKAKCIVFDVVFSDPSIDPKVDQTFAAAMISHGNVVVAADSLPAGYGKEMVNMKVAIPPTEALQEAAAQIGSAGLLPSQDLVMRQHFHGAREDILPSLSWAAAAAVGSELTKVNENRFISRWVNYYGHSGNLPSTSYYLAIDTNETADSVFRDKVVFVGARLFTKFTGQPKDEYRTPYSYWSPNNPFMPGVEVQATIFLNLLRGEWLTRWPAARERTLLIVFGLLFGISIIQFRAWFGVCVALLFATSVMVISYALFINRLVWFPWLIMIGQIGLALLWAIIFNSVRLYVESRLLEQSLSLHLSPSRVRQLMTQPELLKPGAEKHELSILFSDIADFTKMSEGMDSDHLAHMMNSYFESAISRIHETDGTVVKLIGDAIFAIWNAPLTQMDHRERACRAALALRDQPVHFKVGEKELILFTRIGLHTGVANVGNFGSTTRFDYTALGENINLASRMEGLNKHLGTQLLVTGETHEGVVGKLLTRHVGHFKLKGFEKTVEVFELVGALELEESTKAWRESFSKGLALYIAKDFGGSRDAFETTLKLRPDDGPSRFYLKLIKEIGGIDTAMDWTGHTQMTEK